MKFKVGDRIRKSSDPANEFLIKRIWGNEYVYDIYTNGQFRQSFHFHHESIDSHFQLVRGKRVVKHSLP